MCLPGQESSRMQSLERRARKLDSLAPSGANIRSKDGCLVAMLRGKQTVIVVVEQDYTKAITLELVRIWQKFPQFEKSFPRHIRAFQRNLDSIDVGSFILRKEIKDFDCDERLLVNTVIQSRIVDLFINMKGFVPISFPTAPDREGLNPTTPHPQCPTTLPRISR